MKSNAIVFAREGTTIGVGAGQMSRVYSSRVAAMKAADERPRVAGAVMASDAFFPFRDGLDVAAEYGIKAVIQPGGSQARRRSHRRRGRARHGDGVHRHAALPALIRMKVLIIGAGGREHALAWKCAQSPRVTEVLVAPGNAGTATEPQGAQRRRRRRKTSRGSSRSRRPRSVGLTIVGPEGAAGRRRRRCVPAARPALLRARAQAAAQLEGSKAFTKEFLKRHGIPTAAYATFTRETFDRGLRARSSARRSS